MGRPEKRRAIKSLVQDSKAGKETKSHLDKAFLLGVVIRAKCESFFLMDLYRAHMSMDFKLIELIEESVFPMFLMLRGIAKQLNVECGLCNLYASNDDGERRISGRKFSGSRAR